MARWKLGIGIGIGALAVLVSGCEDDLVLVGAAPEPPEELEGSYYAAGVDLSWRLAAGWNGETFRVYSRRVTDPEYFMIAETTSCIANTCSHRDTNVKPGNTYEYYVAAVDPDSGAETAGAYSIEVAVPRPVPPPVPELLVAVALDNAVYLRWDDEPATADDFAAYRIYLRGSEDDYFLGETDSPGYVDFLAENGVTSSYMVTSLDTQGHESDYSEAASATPRPDYTGEIVYTYQDSADVSGFRFQESEQNQAVISGDDPGRHFRIEADVEALWIVPGPGVEIHPETRWTSALKCGPGSDADCVSWEHAPRSGYAPADAAIGASLAYMFRVTGDDRQIRYGVVRVASTGVDHDGREVIVMDWAYQTQPDNRSLDGATGFR